jgi:hypothetical protein
VRCGCCSGHNDYGCRGGWWWWRCGRGWGFDVGYRCSYCGAYKLLVCHISSIFSRIEYLQPMPEQRKPGKQHPPLGASGHEEYPLFVSQLILPAHLCPCGQQPTEPTPGLSLTVIHVLPVPQHTSGAPIEEQLVVPAGQANCLFDKAARTCNREKKSSSVRGRSGDSALHVSFP